MEKIKRMKNCTLVLIGLLLCAGSYGQSQKNASNYNQNVDSVAEALVAMAMNNASIKTDMMLAQQFKYLYKASKTSWLNNIALQGNVNEFSFKNSATSDPLKQSTQYPKYNFGVVIPFGMFINNPKQAKADYYKYQFAMEQVNVDKQNVRRDVLINWQDYKMNKKLLAQHEELVNDWRIIHQKNEQKFSNGEISLETFYNSTKTYTEELNKQETINSALRTTAAKLEALIGMNIEDALTQISVQGGPSQNSAPASKTRK